VAYHGYPRFTNDIDVFFDPSDKNVARLRKALISFGFDDKDLPFEAFTTKGNILTFGVVPNRVDFINEVDGISFEEASQKVVRGNYGDVEVNFIGFEDLVKNKQSTSRLKDKSDVEELTKK
jgi:hypothetical protein